MLNVTDISIFVLHILICEMCIICFFQIIELTGCSQDKAEIALFDSKNDVERAVDQLLEGGTDEVWGFKFM